jgi:hypothetical protein
MNTWDPRRTGAATTLIDALRAHAVGWPRLALVAVDASVPFWRRHGFEVVTVPGLAERLAGHDASACSWPRRRIDRAGPGSVRLAFPGRPAVDVALQHVGIRQNSAVGSTCIPGV